MYNMYYKYNALYNKYITFIQLQMYKYVYVDIHSLEFLWCHIASISKFKKYCLASLFIFHFF